MSKSALDYPLEAAREIAQKYISDLAPYCDRIEIAGSIRREKPAVHDIEIVAIPKLETKADMFGTVTGYTSQVDQEIVRLASKWGAVFKKGGPKYKQLALAEGLNLDLFLVTPPAHWGVIFAIRTGPSDFSNQLVTAKRYRTHENRPGFLPSYAKSEDGQIMHRETGEVYPMPEEEDFFKFCGLDYIRPKDRR